MGVSYSASYSALYVTQKIDFRHYDTLEIEAKYKTNSSSLGGYFYYGLSNSMGINTTSTTTNNEYVTGTGDSRTEDATNYYVSGAYWESGKFSNTSYQTTPKVFKQDISKYNNDYYLRFRLFHGTGETTHTVNVLFSKIALY